MVRSNRLNPTQSPNVSIVRTRGNASPGLFPGSTLCGGQYLHRPTLRTGSQREACSSHNRTSAAVPGYMSSERFHFAAWVEAGGCLLHAGNIDFAVWVGTRHSIHYQRIMRGGHVHLAVGNDG